MAPGFSLNPAQTDNLDFLISSKIKEDEETVKQRLHRFAYESVTHPVNVQYERTASVSYRYIENDPYTDEELAEFEERGQPPTRRNEAAPILEKLTGQFIQTRQQVTFLGRNTPADDEAGAIAQDYQRWNDQQNMFEFEEQDMAWDGLVGGVGWLKGYAKQNELGEMVETWKALNPFYVKKDPYHTKYNPNDGAKYMCECPWMDLEDLIALHPEKEDELRKINFGNGAYQPYVASNIHPSLLNEALSSSVFADGLYLDYARRRVRPFEIWYKRKVRIYHLFRQDGVLAIPVPLDQKSAQEAVRQLDGEVYAQSSWQDRMYMGIILADILIHHDVSPYEHNYFPYVPFYSGLRKNGCPLSLGERLIPIVDSINKRESKALTLLTNRQVAYEEDAVEDDDALDTEVSRPDGRIKLRQGAISGQKILFRDNLDLGQGQLNLLQEDKDALRRVSGQGDESMGMPSEVRSGTGIARKQMMGNLIATPVQNNLRRTRYLKAQLSFALMKQFCTEEMAFAITDNPNAPRIVRMTKGHINAFRQFRYDMVITEMKDYAVLREQQIEILMQAIPALAQLGPQYVKLGVHLTELRDKEAIIQWIDQQSAAQPMVPKMSLAMTWADLTPEMQAFIAMTAWQSEELARAIMEKGDDPAFLQKLKADLIKAQLTEGMKASVERGKLDINALQAAIEGRMKIRELTQKEMPQIGQSASSGASTNTTEGDETL
jgi:hypothetical protein